MSGFRGLQVAFQNLSGNDLKAIGTDRLIVSIFVLGMQKNSGGNIGHVFHL
jgi:hypothetical protein